MVLVWMTPVKSILVTVRAYVKSLEGTSVEDPRSFNTFIVKLIADACTVAQLLATHWVLLGTARNAS